MTSFDKAVYANIRDLLERLADNDSSELIKKFLNLDSLVRYFRKVAEEDSDLIDNLFDKLKLALSRGREIKAQQNAIKRALAQEQAKGKRDMTKKRKLRRTSFDESLRSGIVHGPQRQHRRMDDVSAQAENRRSASCSDYGTLQQPQIVRQDLAHSTTAITDSEDDGNGNAIGSSPRRPSKRPQIHTESSDSDISTASLPSRFRPNSSRTNGDHEMRTPSPPLISPLTPRPRSPSTTSEVLMIASAASNAENTSLERSPSGETAQAATKTADVVQALPNRQPTRATEASSEVTSSEVAVNQEFAVVPHKQDEAEEWKNQLIRYIWPHFDEKYTVEKRDQDLEEIMTMMVRLNFYAIQYRLCHFAEKRLKSPGLIAKVSELADNSDPVEVFDAIEASSVCENDAKLHKVYGQMQLVKSIQEKIKRGETPGEAKLLKNTLVSGYPKWFLQDMAEGMTKGEPKHIQKKTRDKLQREYQAGKKWMDTIETFNGEGIVFIFIFAGE